MGFKSPPKQSEQKQMLALQLSHKSNFLASINASFSFAQILTAYPLKNRFNKRLMAEMDYER
jgi:hypothetical protein